MTNSEAVSGANRFRFTVECTHDSGTICGVAYKHTLYVEGDASYGTADGAGKHCKNYGVNTFTHNVDVGNYHYELGCGKSTDTIVGATIVWDE